MSSPEEAASKSLSETSSVGAHTRGDSIVMDIPVSHLPITLSTLTEFCQTQSYGQSDVPLRRSLRSPKRRISNEKTRPPPLAQRAGDGEAGATRVTTKIATQRVTRNTASLGQWADPKSSQWDIFRVLQSKECLAPDPLLDRPSKNYSYIDSKGRLKNPLKYASTLDEESVVHPKLAAHRLNGTETKENRLYYHCMPPDRCLPIAGIIRDHPDPRDVESHSLPGRVAGTSSSPADFQEQYGRDSSPERVSSIDPEPALTYNSSSVGRELPCKTIDQARDTGPHKGHARRRLGKRNKEPATRAPSLRSSRKRDSEGLS